MSRNCYRAGLFYRTVDSLEGVKPELRTGTLGYTMLGLLVTVMFLLMGSFGYNMVIQVIGNLMPRQLKDAGASNAVIALFITTIPSVITMICNPVFSTWSDCTRTRFGRRQPFLLLSAPLLALCMVAMGWAPEISHWVTGLPGMDNPVVPLMILGALSVVCSILFMFPGAILWYLFPDTVPDKYIARYMAFYNIVAQGAGVLFGSQLIGYAQDYLRWLYTGVAVVFLAAMVLLFWGVREGDYPPREDRPFGQNLSSVLKTYFLDCFGVPFYWWFFLAMSLSDASTICRVMFNLLYAENQLGVSLASYGKILSYGSIIGVVLSVPLAWLSDRIHPMRFFMLSLFTVVVVNLVSFYYVSNEQTFLVSSIMLAVVYTMQLVSTIPVFVTILPRSQYGQFSSANMLFRSVFLAVLGYAGGKLIDCLGNYQYIYAWDFVFTLASLLAFIGLFIHWRKLGGPDHYLAPTYPRG